MLGLVPSHSQSTSSSQTELLSIVTPVYNESKNVSILLDRLVQTLSSLNHPYEIICINDGSADDTLHYLTIAAQKNSSIKIINLSRNFGHQIAISAGIEFAKGAAVIVMDSDLQDPPEFIPTLVQKWKEGFDVVYAVRQKRKGESFIKLFLASAFYRIMQKMSKFDIPVDTGDFRLMSRTIVQILLSMPERQRFIRGMVSWAGFRQIGVPFERDKRLSGEAKYTYIKLFRLAFDGITSFSYLPLQFSSYLGFFCALISFALMLIGLYAKIFAKPYIIEGWTSIFVVGLFIGGIQLLMIGLLGEYIGRIHDEIKCRPLYIVQSTTNISPS